MTVTDPEYTFVTEIQKVTGVSDRNLMGQIDSYVDGFQDKKDQSIHKTGSTSIEASLNSLGQLFQNKVVL